MEEWPRARGAQHILSREQRGDSIRDALASLACAFIGDASPGKAAPGQPVGRVHRHVAASPHRAVLPRTSLRIRLRSCRELFLGKGMPHSSPRTQAGAGEGRRGPRLARRRRQASSARGLGRRAWMVLGEGVDGWWFGASRPAPPPRGPLRHQSGFLAQRRGTNRGRALSARVKGRSAWPGDGHAL